MTDGRIDAQELCIVCRHRTAYSRAEHSSPDGPIGDEE
jgi:hypothetical protein